MELKELLKVSGLDEEFVHEIKKVDFVSVVEPYCISDGSPEGEQFLADLRLEIGEEIEKVEPGRYWEVVNVMDEPFSEPEEFELMDGLADYHFSIEMGALADDIWLIRAE